MTHIEQAECPTVTPLSAGEVSMRRRFAGIIRPVDGPLSMSEKVQRLETLRTHRLNDYCVLLGLKEPNSLQVIGVKKPHPMERVVHNYEELNSFLRSFSWPIILDTGISKLNGDPIHSSVAFSTVVKNSPLQAEYMRAHSALVVCGVGRAASIPENQILSHLASLGFSVGHSVDHVIDTAHGFIESEMKHSYKDKVLQELHTLAESILVACPEWDCESRDMQWQELAKIPTLSTDAKSYLFIQMENKWAVGESYQEERSLLATSNLKLVRLYVQARINHFSRAPVGDFMDSVQEGTIALLHSIDAYNFRYGRHLSTLVHATLRKHFAALQKSQYQTGATHEITALYHQLLHAKHQFFNAHGREPSLEEWAVCASVDSKWLTNFLVKEAPPTGANSIDAPDAASKDDTPLKDTIHSGGSFESDTIMDTLRDELGKIIDGDSRLSKKERRMLTLQYGLDPQMPYLYLSDADVGRVVGISRQAATKALTKARRIFTDPVGRPAAMEALRDYLV